MVLPEWWMLGNWTGGPFSPFVFCILFFYLFVFLFGCVCLGCGGMRDLSLWNTGSRARRLSSHSMWDLGSPTRDWTLVPCLPRWIFLPSGPLGKPHPFHILRTEFCIIHTWHPAIYPERQKKGRVVFPFLNKWKKYFKTHESHMKCNLQSP